MFKIFHGVFGGGTCLAMPKTILHAGAVSWCSYKQSVMAGSTCEAEYIAASEAANEGVWMKEFKVDQSKKGF